MPSFIYIPVPASASDIPPFEYLNTYLLGTPTAGPITISSAGLGTPHDQRRIFLVGLDNNVFTSLLVDGVAASKVESRGSYAIWMAAATDNPTGNIEITASANIRYGLSIFAGYPLSDTPLFKADMGGDTNLITNVIVAAGGFVLATGGYSNTSDPFTETWSGTETVNERHDGGIGGTSNSAHYVADIQIVTGSSERSYEVTHTGSWNGCMASFGADH